ncbi:hypothetical protein KVR01_007591 [Diaporthe batatas]|uniref:uncharacterized protein n=1 Tax=Diaporthe batatas TaxID=748121 RepID=UPI001D05912F|nr:uncharacterized protein KVR01_007591 [Diaporthe batatas]KAG8163113.1 hypothetical protein KVR01_007591 [Diaporthe batatas]
MNPTPTITSNATWNESLSCLKAERTQYFWFTDEDWQQSIGEDGCPDGCLKLMETYCFPTPDAPVPTSPSRIPAVRTLYHPADPTTINPAGAKPTPYQSGMVTGCQRFYKVSTGDTCQKIANTASTTLEQL